MLTADADGLREVLLQAIAPRMHDKYRAYDQMRRENNESPHILLMVSLAAMLPQFARFK